MELVEASISSELLSRSQAMEHMPEQYARCIMTHKCSLDPRATQNEIVQLSLPMADRMDVNAATLVDQLAYTF